MIKVYYEFNYNNMHDIIIKIQRKEENEEKYYKKLYI